MSRTDKDKPWQLRAAEGQSGSYVSHLCGGGLDCELDLDPYEVWKHAFDGRRFPWKSPLCGRMMSHGALSSPPAWYIEHVWTRVERGRERVGLGEIAKAFNAGGDVSDADLANFQHRHMACWRYW